MVGHTPVVGIRAPAMAVPIQERRKWTFTLFEGTFLALCPEVRKDHENHSPVVHRGSGEDSSCQEQRRIG